MFVGQIVEITEEITLSKRKRCPQYPEEQYSGIIEWIIISNSLLDSTGHNMRVQHPRTCHNYVI